MVSINDLVKGVGIGGLIHSKIVYDIHKLYHVNKANVSMLLGLDSLGSARTQTLQYLCCSTYSSITRSLEYLLLHGFVDRVEGEPSGKRPRGYVYRLSFKGRVVVDHYKREYIKRFYMVQTIRMGKARDKAEVAEAEKLIKEEYKRQGIVI